MERGRRWCPPQPGRASVERSGSPRRAPRHRAASSVAPAAREHHADAGQHLARKGVAAKVGLTIASAGGSAPGQIVIGDQDLPSQCFRRRNASMAGDAVVDSRQQVGLERGKLGHQPRRKAIAMDHATRDGRRHPCRPEHAQAAPANGASGGAVAIEVADHDDVPDHSDRIGEQGGRRRKPTERVGRQQVRELRLRLREVGRAASGVDTTQQGRHRIGPASCRVGLGAGGYVGLEPWVQLRQRLPPESPAWSRRRRKIAPSSKSRVSDCRSRLLTASSSGCTAS